MTEDDWDMQEKCLEGDSPGRLLSQIVFNLQLESEKELVIQRSKGRTFQARARAVQRPGGRKVDGVLQKQKRAVRPRKRVQLSKTQERWVRHGHSGLTRSR